MQDTQLMQIVLLPGLSISQSFQSGLFSSLLFQKQTEKDLNRVAVLQASFRDYFGQRIQTFINCQSGNLSKWAYNNSMSFIINNPKNAYFFDFKRITSKKPSIKEKRPPSQTLQEKKNISKHIEEALSLKHHTYAVTATNHSRLITVGPFELTQRFSALVTLVEGKGGEVAIKITVLTSNQRYLMIETLERRILMIRGIALGHSLPSGSLFKIGVNLFNGELTLALPPSLLNSTTILIPAALRQVGLLYRLIDETLLETKATLEWLLRLAPRGIQSEIELIKATQQLGRLQRMLNIFRRANEGVEVRTQKTIREIKLKEVQSIRQHLAKKEQVPFHLLHSLMPFHRFQQSYGPKSQEECRWTSYESEALKRLAIPSRKTYQNPHASLLLTHILLSNPQQVKPLQQVATGGFSSIFLADLQFCYVDANQQNQRGADMGWRKWERRTFAIKRDGGAYSGKGRNLHELSIMQKLKSSTSLLLNRYYLPVNGQGSDILMDYIPFPTLKEYLLLSQNSISLHTKLYLMVSLQQGLRSLARCDVAHLDLKPNNIMLSPELLIKLVDFGESYHPEVKGKPGNTEPYSCPQVYAGNEHFTIKNDLYSFGVILFEILSGRRPFSLQLQRNQWKYRSGNYLQHWLYAPEQTESMGDSRVYFCLSQLVSQCLDPDPSRRPDIMMVGLLLLECLHALRCA